MLKLQNILHLYLCSISVGTVWTESFKAAVVEYSPLFYDHPVIPEMRIMEAVDLYKVLARQNPSNYDIIVFPEATLYTGAGFRTSSDIFPFSTLVPEPNSGIVACNCSGYKYASFFKELSCLAKETGKFVSINLAENVPCKEDCPAVGFNTYNTNVVFDGNGKVVARYRKFNLFGEVYMSKPSMQVETFMLKAGVKIGIFTCFDLIFREPAMDLVKNEKIQAVIFPLMWYSELPFLTALQSQQQWARELDIVLLAAGANFPWTGTGGSGIHKGKRGYQQAIITSKREATILYDDIDPTAEQKSAARSLEDIDTEAKEMDTFYLMKENIESYTSKLLEFSVKNIKTVVCNGEENNRLCCNFDVETTVNEHILNDNNNHYQYHLVAFSGVRSFSGVATAGIEICAVIACKNETIDACGQRFPDYSSISWPLTFTKLEVKAKFVKDEKRIQFPNSLLSNIHPLPVEESEWRTVDHKNTTERKHALLKNQERLLTFGIFGRDFTRDGQNATKPSSPPAAQDPDYKDKNDNKDSRSSFIGLNFAAVVFACLLFLTNIGIE